MPLDAKLALPANESQKARKGRAGHRCAPARPHQQFCLLLNESGPFQRHVETRHWRYDGAGSEGVEPFAQLRAQCPVYVDNENARRLCGQSMPGSPQRDR